MPCAMGRPRALTCVSLQLQLLMRAALRALALPLPGGSPTVHARLYTQGDLANVREPSGHRLP